MAQETIKTTLYEKSSSINFTMLAISSYGITSFIKRLPSPRGVDMTIKNVFPL